MAHATSNIVLFPWTNSMTRLAKLIPEPLLSSAGFIALANSKSLTRLTAARPQPSLTSFSEFGVIDDVSLQCNGEYPACAAMTTGYVFRVENEAMVFYMQRMGRTGQLTTLRLSTGLPMSKGVRTARYLGISMISLSILVLGVVASLDDRYAVAAWWIYFVARWLDLLVLSRRQTDDWKGKKEPGKTSDLLVLLSNDRWIRLCGLTDDVKLVTSGAWLRKPTFSEGLCVTLARVLIYLNIGIVAAATKEGKMLLLVYMLASIVIVELSNELTDELQLFGKTIQIDGERKSYGRRLDMAEELVAEVGRHDWCEKMGIILNRTTSQSTGAVIM